MHHSCRKVTGTASQCISIRIDTRARPNTRSRRVFLWRTVLSTRIEQAEDRAAKKARKEAEKFEDTEWNAKARLAEYPASADRALWRAVISQAIEDSCRPQLAVSGPRDRFANESNLEKPIARRWLIGAGDDFKQVCTLADLEPDAVRDRANALRNREWKVKIPIAA